MILVQENKVVDEDVVAVILVDKKFEGLTQRKVKERNERTKQKHGNEDDDGGIIQFLVLSKSLLFGIPRPSGFSEFQNNFAPVFADSVHVWF
jgi:hypothetical protein